MGGDGVFKRLQKLVFVVIALRSGGRTFQALGPATTNATIYQHSASRGLSAVATIYLFSQRKLVSQLRCNCLVMSKTMRKYRNDSLINEHKSMYIKLEIRSVEHGICPIAEFTSP